MQETSLAVLREEGCRAVCLPVRRKEEEEGGGHNRFQYTYPSLFTGWYFAVSQIRGVAPRIKIHHSDRSTRIVRQLEQVFEQYRMMFKDLKEKKEAAPISMFLQGN
jgi:hypothetical protein